MSFFTGRRRTEDSRTKDNDVDLQEVSRTRWTVTCRSRGGEAEMIISWCRFGWMDGWMDAQESIQRTYFNIVREDTVMSWHIFGKRWTTAVGERMLRVRSPGWVWGDTRNLGKTDSRSLRASVWNHRMITWLESVVLEMYIMAVGWITIK